MNHVIRAVRADEWAEVRELRLVALQDPAASIAFLDTYEQASQRPDSFWQERAAGVVEGGGAQLFVAEAPDGSWSGTVGLLIEPAGLTDFFGTTIERPQGHLVGVFVRPGQRGGGLIDGLVEAALDWAWSLEEPRLERVRLHVHESNGRARAVYRRLGFEPTGVLVPFAPDPSAKEQEMAVVRPAAG
ncbi:GNAT family N-acetyltransferase [Streptomyces sp. NPDC006638]|uniref:GNAT family N-acetyltransferase n=1 Tax=Streptomyces sp. NPDC006638 TaxID=3157183 RepID=UPI0033AF0601